MLPQFDPIRPLTRMPRACDGEEWISEIKYDGFRALAYVENSTARLVSRKRHVYKSFPQLCKDLGCLAVEDAVIDGEIVSLDDGGRPQFFDLLKKRGPTYFYAFDLLWRDGRCLTDL